MDDKTILLLGYYYDEWKFRQENLWKRIIQFFVIIFFVSTFPITIDAFAGISMPSNFPLIAFPIIGIALSLFFLLFCLSESSRINAMDSKIKNIIRDKFPEYAKDTLPPLKAITDSKPKQAFLIFRWRMAIWVPVFLSSTQIALAIFMIVLILNEKLQ